MVVRKGLVALGSASLALAQITVYGQLPLGQTVATTAEWATTTVRAAYNTTELNLPENPIPPEGASNAFTVQLQSDANTVQGISIPHNGAAFYGFSVEMSVINQVLGKNSSYINPALMNLLANLEERAGSVNVRLGGNTQEYAIHVQPDDERLEEGLSYGKTASSSTGTTLTPSVLYTIEMFYSCANISKHVNVNWFLGIPFDDPVNWRLDIAELGEEILGDRLLALQVGNEPDFYVSFSRRAPGYTPYDYHREVGDVIEVMSTNDRIPRKRNLLAPSTSGQVWHAEDVFATGFLDDFVDYLWGITVEHYPHNNCYAMYGGDPNNYNPPQDMLPYYLNHNNVVELIRPYWVTAATAIEHNKPLMMFETNTASCGGFPGISNTFVAAMWGLDYGLQMASANFTHAMLHVGGQNVFYNPFTSPPTEYAAFNQWTVGPIFYSALVMAEALGKSNTARVVDLFPNAAHPSTPGYAIYENDRLSKVALLNFVSDTTGASDIVASLTVDGGVPASVSVKYLLAEQIISKNNITWAGQTFGNQFEADGRLKGDLNVTTVECSVSENVCRIPVPAPGFALVFLNNEDEGVRVSQAAATFATTVHLKSHNTATWDAKALETSNGHSGVNRLEMAGTSLGIRHKNAAGASHAAAGRAALALGAAVASALWFALL